MHSDVDGFWQRRAGAKGPTSRSDNHSRQEELCCQSCSQISHRVFFYKQLMKAFFPPLCWPMRGHICTKLFSRRHVVWEHTSTVLFNECDARHSQAVRYFACGPAAEAVSPCPSLCTVCSWHTCERNLLCGSRVSNPSLE